MDNVSVEKTKLDKIADSIATADGGGNMTLDDMPGRIGALGANNVKYIPQELTEGQKAQARGNISALPVGLGMADASVGDLLRVKTVDALGVPTALEPVSVEDLEGKWELIEKFTANESAEIIRNKEPDGTPYRFSSLAIRIATPNTVSGNDYGFYSIRNKSQIYIGSIRKETPTDPNRAFFIAFINVYGSIMSMLSGQTRELEYDSFPEPLNVSPGFLRAYGDNIITELGTTAYTNIGDVVEIWGVRA